MTVQINLTERAHFFPCGVSLLLMLLLLGPMAAFAEETEEPAEPASRQSQRIPIRLPLVGNAAFQYRSQILRAVDRLLVVENLTQRPLLILEFIPSESGTTTEFENALRLARLLMSDEISGVKTVAYLPRTIEGHAVLAALACEEIAMDPDAEIGHAGIAEDASRPLEPAILAGYRQVAETRRTAPAAVTLAMVDPQAQLLRIESEDGIDYVLAADAVELEAQRSVIQKETLTPVGSLALFTGREGREIGFVRYLAADRPALARLLGVAAEQLEAGSAQFGSWRPVMIDLEGPLTPALGRRIETLIGMEIDQNRVNWIGLRIDSSGGDWSTALRLAQTLAELAGEEAHTVAYVPRRAEGPAALVALVCEDLVLQEGATLAGNALLADDQVALDEVRLEKVEEENKEEDEAAAGQEPEADDKPIEPAPRDAAARDEIGAIVTTLRTELAPQTSRTWSLLAAVVDSELEVSLYRHRETGQVRPLSEEELATLEGRRAWQRTDSLKAAGEPFHLDTGRAEELGIATHAIEQFDDLSVLYGFEVPPRTAQPNWALELVEALASPGFAALLLVLGVVGLYIEISTPGLGIGGFIATLAFVLFFWSKFLHGTADWLEVLLFVSGVVFLLVELLILPGLGIFGLGGGLLVVSALVLASQTFVLPKTGAQLEELRDSLGVVAGAGVACIAVGMVLRHYLPHSPLFRRMMLMPDDEADRVELAHREAIADYEYLVGQSGVTSTPLLPSGRAEVAGELVDVITDGEAIDPGETITVVSAQANRVVVRRVQG